MNATEKKFSGIRFLRHLAPVLLALLIGFATASCAATKKSADVAAATGENTVAVKLFNTSTHFTCNVHIISSNKGNILIDPGYYDGEMKNYIEEIGGLDAVLLTHGHWDHIYGLDDLKADFPETDVYIFEKDYGFLTDTELNCSAVSGFQLIIKSDVQKIQEGTLNIGDYAIEVTNTPGHTIGSVMYYFKDENILFSGDTILIDCTGPTFRPTGSDEDMKESVRKFKGFGYSDETPVYAGHRAATTYGYILHNNKDVKDVM